MSAYKVAEAKDFIKLDAMENPYTWPDNIKQEWLKEIKKCPINLYPDPEAGQLVTALKESNQTPSQSELLLGNGSDEIIQLLLMSLPENSHVLAPSPGFVMYQQVALSLGLNYHNIPLLSDTFDLDLASILNAIKQYQPLIIFLAYPNNPTGNLFKQEDINTT